MGSSSEGPAPQARAVPARAPEQDPAPRGFLGRLLSALTPSAEGGSAAQAPAPPSGGALGALRRLRVDDVAIPKTDIVAVPIDIGRDDLVAVFREHGFSRLPVYKGTPDHPQGQVLLKDFALQHGFGQGGRFSLKRLLRPILFAPPSMPAAALLQKMQKERAHMALVIDEYGGVDGLVTIEDLIETVIGEIEDEHDEAAASLWAEESPGVILAPSTAPLDELERALGVRLRSGDDDDEVDTIGGLVFLRTGRVPARGEIVTLENGAGIEVVEADPRRIKRVRLRLPGALPSPDAAAGAAADAASGAG